MRRIGLIERATDAKRFGDFLLTKGITTQIRPSDEGHVVWVRDENKVQQAAEELKRFQEDSTRPEYNQVHRAAAEIRAANNKLDREYRRRQMDVGAPPHERNPVTTALTVVTVVVFLFFTPATQLLLEFAVRPALGPVEIQQGQIWRLVTPIFLHADMLHLIMNMVIFWQLGGLVERTVGRWKFAGLILFLAIGSNYAQFLLQVVQSDPARFRGMSGVVFGLLGFILARNTMGGDLRMSLSPTFVVIAVAWLVLGAIGALEQAFGISVANGAHVGGMVLGFLAGAAPKLWDSRKPA